MHSSAEDGGNRLEREEDGVSSGEMLLLESSCAYSNSLRLPGEVIAEVRAALYGDSGLKLGCDKIGSVAWLDCSTSLNTSLSSESSCHPNSSVSSAIIRAFALFGGVLNWRGGTSVALRSVWGVSRPMPVRYKFLDGVRYMESRYSGSERELERRVSFSRTAASSAQRKKPHCFPGGFWQVQTGLNQYGCKEAGSGFVKLTESSLILAGLLGLSFGCGQTFGAVAHPHAVLKKPFQGRRCARAHRGFFAWGKHGGMLS